VLKDINPMMAIGNASPFIGKRFRAARFTLPAPDKKLLIMLIFFNLSFNEVSGICLCTETVIRIVVSAGEG
jgi:hypothetical protein